jgi:hypothetical protein
VLPLVHSKIKRAAAQPGVGCPQVLWLLLFRLHQVRELGLKPLVAHEEEQARLEVVLAFAPQHRIIVQLVVFKSNN